MRNVVVAVTGDLLERFAAVLGDAYRLVPMPRGAAHPPSDARALIVPGGEGVSAALIAAMPALELIAVDGVGYNGIDLDAARARGIRVTNTPGVLTADAADLAIGLMIAVERSIVACDRYVREGRWAAREPMPLGRRASGRRVGIVGLGRIGSAIARRLEAMDCTIAYAGRREAPGVKWRYQPDLLALAAESDVLILSVPGGPETEGLIGAEAIERLGPQGVLINVARGSVIDEAALVAALGEGRLGGAGLDVFADEPNVPVALLDLDNVVLQPHRGSATAETRAAMAALVAENIAAHFAGAEPVTPVV